MAVTIFSTGLGLAIIELGRRIINIITNPPAGAGEALRLLLLYAALMLFAIIIGGVVSFLINILFARMTQAVLKDIRLKLFNHVLQLPQDFYNKNSIGQIMTRLIDDVANIGQFFSQFFLLPVMNIVMIIFYTGYVFFLNWKLAVAGIITIPATVFILPKLNRKLARLSEEYSDSMAGMSDYLMESLSGINDIRSNQTYRFEESRFVERNDELSAININLAKTAGWLKFFMKVLRGLGPLLVYLYGGFLCFKGQLLAGSLVASIAVISSLYEPLDSFVNFLQEWQQAKVRFDKLDEYLAIKPESQVVPLEEKKAVLPGSILFDNVQFGFNDKEVLLKNIYFNADAGKNIAFVGTSGSGKSLTTALISRIYDPLGGKVFLGKNTTDSIPLYNLRSQVGQVSQTPFLFNDTIKRNILYALLRKSRGTGEGLERWIDFSMLEDIDSLEELDQEISNVVKQVGLFEDIYELGLRSRLSRQEATDKNKVKIIAARKLFLSQTLSKEEGSIEHYDEDRFLEYCSLFENIFFSPEPSIIEEYGCLKEFCRKHLNEQLKPSGLLEKLFNIGIHLAQQDNSLLETLYNKKPRLLKDLGFNRKQVEKRLKINNEIVFAKISSLSMEKLDSSLVGDILELAYNYIPGRSKEELLNEKIKKDIVEARKLVKKNIPEALKGKIKFFDPDKYLDPTSIRENIIFGNIDPLRKMVNTSFDALIKEITKKEGLEELILKLGMEFKVGERGSRLSGGQRQKVAIARILLKNPAILILDEATASLDAASQARITELVKNRLKDKTVIAIAHRLSTIKDYDKILVFDKGEIVEQGAFDELIKLNGLFKKLYYESN